MGFLASLFKSSSKDNVRKRFEKGSQSPELPPNFPEPQACVTHLKLMRTFTRLRCELIEEFLQPSLLQSILSHVADDKKSAAETQLRNEVWQMYLQLASDRFEAWWETLASKDGIGKICQVQISTCVQPGKLESMLHDTKPFIWTEKNLPPIDVLMILHSFMLNPRAFLEDCIRYGMLGLWKAGMPWDLLQQKLDVSNNEYSVPPATQSRWRKMTDHEWDIQQDRLERRLSCPNCMASIVYRSAAMRIRDTNWKLDEIDQEQTFDCEKCRFTFITDHLKVYKLHHAFKNLQQNDIPLPGTILTSNGLVTSSGEAHTESSLIAVNEQLRDALADQILHLTSPDKTRSDSPPQLSDIRVLLERHLEAKDRQDVRTAIQRAFLQFSDTYSRFALDLSAAVVRQCVFIDMMEEVDWLHSPSLEYAINELLTRYEIFFKIMGHNKNNVAVPTYAVDLAWHTHQLSPSCYYAYSVANAGKIFIDHDDRIEEDVRTDAFGWTTEKYKQLTDGKDYGQCLCWYCTTIYETAAQGCSSFSMGKNGHAIVDPGSGLETQVLSKIAASQYQKLEEDYRIACQLAIRTCRLSPSQKEYLQSYKWLYPYAVPVIKG